MEPTLLYKTDCWLNVLERYMYYLDLLGEDHPYVVYLYCLEAMYRA